jgi:precorrin isomerase
MLGKMRTIGSKAEVFHGSADHTSGGLKKKDLMKTSKGRIVSRKKHAAGKKAIQRLFKAGYKPTKGTFTAMRKGMRTTRRKGMRGGFAQKEGSLGSSLGTAAALNNLATMAKSLQAAVPPPAAPPAPAAK